MNILRRNLKRLKIMNDFEKGIIALVKSAITGTKVTVPENFNWQKAFELAEKHQIIPMIYYGVFNSDLTPPNEILSKLEMKTYYCIAVNTKQIFELERIFSAFDQNKICYLPLKGTLLKKLYPNPVLRQMSDADILIKPEQYVKIQEIMSGLGFTEILESDHELIWNKKNALHVELHKRLIPSYNKDYYKYYGDGWKVANPVATQTGRHEMSDEDNLIYLFTHFSKHYRDGGIGIRHMTDLYIFISKKDTLDKKYIENELVKLQLFKFYTNIISTMAVWFDGANENDMTDFITSKILGSGSYGTYSAHVAASALKATKPNDSAKIVRSRKRLKMAFPPYQKMCLIYPFLKKWPVMMPFMWISRIVGAGVFKRKKIRQHEEMLSLMTDETISNYQQELDYVGLSFNFKE